MFRDFFNVGRVDIAEAIRKRNIALIFGWQDVAQRYRRSKIGAFWITINMAVLIGAMGLIFGTLFRASMTEFLPFIAVGLIFWGYISAVISEGCIGLSSADGIILQVRCPVFTHILRLWWRSVIILTHNLVIYPICLLVFQLNPGWHIFLFPLGFILVTANILWIALVLSVACARYRDLPMIVQNFLQILFYATPLTWTPATLPTGPPQFLLHLNPFYHLLSLLRDPLLGNSPSLVSYGLVTILAIFGWMFAIVFFGKYRWRIPYWL